MTDEDLRRYAGQWIEARLADGTTLVGHLSVDEPGFSFRRSFHIEQPSANPDAAGPRITLESLMVDSVRMVSAPPETLD